MLLRPRQKELVANAIAALMEYDNTLVIAPTGAGKTIMLSAVIGELFKTYNIKKACILAHRDELTAQNHNKFKFINPNLQTSIFNATVKSWEGHVTFAMVQTLSRGKNIDTIPFLDAVVIDEAHHIASKSYIRLINQLRTINPKIKILGVTATPMRADKLTLSTIFNNIADQIYIKELIDSGHLVKPRTFVIDVGVTNELKQVNKDNNDYDMNEVANIINTIPINSAIIDHWKAKSQERKTVVFCSTINHALDVTKCFNQEGITAVCLHGNMSELERNGVLHQYTAGDAQVIVNVSVLTEGWDHPPTSCVVLLRPSSHKSTMMQMIGRGLRTVNSNEYPNIVKKDCIILDFGISSFLHGSLDQTINLSANKETANKHHPPFNSKRTCPKCEMILPAKTKECPCCYYEWQDKEPNKLIPTNDFNMIEIDLFNKSNFLWFHSNNEKPPFSMVVGFKVWVCIIQRNDNWYCITGGKGLQTKVLTQGEKMSCFALADDYLNLYEDENTIYKTKPWLKQPATENQLRYLPSSYRLDYNLTRYQASILLTMKFNQKDINNLIN